MKILCAATLLVMLQAAATPPSPAPAPSLEELRRRVGAHVQRFVNGFSSVVAEEDYEQRFGSAPGRRRLKSDFLLVAYPGRTDVVLTFRDVLEVDGQPVTGNKERITRLFLQPFESAARRAADIQREGLRHSLRDGARLTDPLGVIVFLQNSRQDEFRFMLGEPARHLGPDIRELLLIERAAAGRTPIHARTWVSEGTGEIVKTELRRGFAGNARVTTTTFGTDSALKIRVPLEMQDIVPLADDDFHGTARYTNFRRFQVRTDDVLDVPPPPSR